MFKFDPYFKLRDLSFHREDTCLTVLKELMPYFGEKTNIAHPLILLETIIQYVKKSNIDQKYIGNEIEFISNSLHTPFSSDKTVIMFIDHSGKLMSVNKAFQKVYKYSPEQVINNYVGNYTKSVWFENLIESKTLLDDFRYFPGKHINVIKSADANTAPIIGNTWPIIDSEGRFGGAISVHKKLIDEK